MIKLVDCENIHQLLHFKDDVFSTKIKSLYNAYGLEYDFLMFWLQYDEKGNAVSLISRFDGDATLSVDGEPDYTELSEFFNVMGCQSVLASMDNIKKLKLNIKSSGSVMALKSKPQFVPERVTPEPIDYKQIYKLLKSVFDDVGSFDLWFTDISHRVRHNCTEIASVYDRGEAVSCAMVLFKTEKSAIIGSVATNENYRGRGLASKLINQLTKQRDKEVYLMREENKNQSFYNKLGFEDFDFWVIGE